MDEIFFLRYSVSEDDLYQASGVMLMAKFCVNIAFFGCCMHFSHIAASPYTK